MLRVWAVDVTTLDLARRHVCRGTPVSRSHVGARDISTADASAHPEPSRAHQPRSVCACVCVCVRAPSPARASHVVEQVTSLGLIRDVPG